MKSKYLILFYFLNLHLFAQIIPNNFQFQNIITLSQSSNSPLSNTITDIATQGDTIWLGTNRGLSRSTDAGISWKNYYGDSLFQNESISAIAVKGKTVWVSTAHTNKIDGNYMPEGSGLKYSIDGGETWKSIPQPVDTTNIDTLKYGNNKIRALGITTKINNITYDIAISNSSVWIASFAGMARRSSDNGKTWQRVILPPDNLNSISPGEILNFDLSPASGSLNLQQNLNHRVFSVHVQDDQTIWFGTAGGINKSTNDGISWTKYTFNNQSYPISGNFVVAINSNKKTNSVWAGTINAESPSEQRGISFTNNNGTTWNKTLLGNFVHNIGFKDSIIYVATDDGFYRSDNLGSYWYSPGIILNSSTQQKYTTKKFYSAASTKKFIFLGGNDGLISTTESTFSPFGSSWKFYRAAQPLASSQTIYAYPNPFDPNDEVTRIRYSLSAGNNNVTIRVFDFEMNLVSTVLQNANRTATNNGEERDDIWNGKDNSGNYVANGVYFYQLTLNNNKPLWGKILVIQ